MNTLKFGNGEWYGKKDTILAYNDLNSNYKPLPFNFSRASSATVINKDGLIETVGSGQPRIDYLGNTQGALKLEPSRTNLITYSEDFPRTYWTKSGATIQGDPSTLGSELVTNGDFATDTWWLKSSANVNISNGKGNFTAGTTEYFYKPNILTVGKTYKLVFEITDYTTGYISGFGSSFGAAATAIGTYERVFTCVDTSFGVVGNSFVGSIDNVSVKEVQGFTSPDGTNNAYKLVEGTNNGEHTVYKLNASISSGINYTYSVFVKGTERVLQMVLSSGFSSNFCNFDLSDGTIGSNNGLVDSNITSFSNGWYRCDITVLSSGTSANLELILAESKSSSRYTTYQGDGTSSIYIYGAQFEEGSYATSYIPTQGSAVTRLADACNNSGNDQVINSTEGVLYAEIKALSEIGGNRYISLSDGTDSNRIILRFQDTDKVGCYVRSASGSDADITKTSASISLNFLKVAVKWKTNDVALWVNGVEVGVDSSFTTFNANVLNRLNLTGATTTTSQYFYGNVKDLKVYNTALTDSELAALTTI